jgi:hypothetical protein
MNLDTNLGDEAIRPYPETFFFSFFSGSAGTNNPCLYWLTPADLCALMVNQHPDPELKPYADKIHKDTHIWLNTPIELRKATKIKPYMPAFVPCGHILIGEERKEENIKYPTRVITVDFDGLPEATGAPDEDPQTVVDIEFLMQSICKVVGVPLFTMRGMSGHGSLKLFFVYNLQGYETGALPPNALLQVHEQLKERFAQLWEWPTIAHCWDKSAGLISQSCALAAQKDGDPAFNDNSNYYTPIDVIYDPQWEPPTGTKKPQNKGYNAPKLEGSINYIHTPETLANTLEIAKNRIDRLVIKEGGDGQHNFCVAFLLHVIDYGLPSDIAERMLIEAGISPERAKRKVYREIYPRVAKRYASRWLQSPVAAPTTALTLQCDRYLSEVREPILEALENNVKLILQAPTGSGKSTLVEWLPEILRLPVVMAMPTIALVKQYAHLHTEFAPVFGKRKTELEYRDVDTSKCVVCTYDSLHLVKQTSDDFILVIDEVHQLSEAYGYRSECIRKVLETAHRANFVLGLTGTTVASLDNILKSVTMRVTPAHRQRKELTYTVIGRKNKAGTIASKVSSVLAACKAKQAPLPVFVVRLNSVVELERLRAELITAGVFDSKQISLTLSSWNDNTRPEHNSCFESITGSERIPDGIRCLLVTSFFDTGINIKNLNVYPIFVEHYSPAHPSEIVQYFARFRMGDKITGWLALETRQVKRIFTESELQANIATELEHYANDLTTAAGRGYEAEKKEFDKYNPNKGRRYQVLINSNTGLPTFTTCPASVAYAVNTGLAYSRTPEMKLAAITALDPSISFIPADLATVEAPPQTETKYTRAEVFDTLCECVKLNEDYAISLVYKSKFGLPEVVKEACTPHTGSTQHSAAIAHFGAEKVKPILANPNAAGEYLQNYSFLRLCKFLRLGAAEKVRDTATGKHWAGFAYRLCVWACIHLFHLGSDKDLRKLISVYTRVETEYLAAYFETLKGIVASKAPQTWETITGKLNEGKPAGAKALSKNYVEWFCKALYEVEVTRQQKGGKRVLLVVFREPLTAEKFAESMGITRDSWQQISKNLQTANTTPVTA